MRYLLKYFIKRLPREGFKSLSVPALALTLVFLINVMGGVQARMVAEYEYTMDNYPIYVEVSDGDGTATDGLLIGEPYLSQFTDPEALWSLYDFVDNVQLRRTYETIIDSGTSDGSRLVSLMDYDSVNEFIKQAYGLDDSEISVDYIVDDDFWENSQETWYIGTCYVSETALGLAEDGFISFTAITQRGSGLITSDFHLQVIGTVSGITDERVVFASEETVINVVLGFNQSQWNSLCNANIPVPYIPGLSVMDRNLWYVPYDEVETQITFLEGYDSSIFTPDEHYCVVSEDVLGLLNDGELNATYYQTAKSGMTRTRKIDIPVVGVLDPEYTNAVTSPFLHDQIGSTYYRSYLDTRIRFDTDDSAFGFLIGTTAPGLEDGQTPGEAVLIEYFEGYDESIFLTDERVCIVSDDVLPHTENGIFVTDVRTASAGIISVELKIIGTASGAAENTVYLPFPAALGFEEENRWQQPYTDRIRATIADNRDLVDFKQNAMRTFKEVGVFFNAQVFSMVIYDSEFYSITEALTQTIYFIDIATPFVYLIAICVGFVASFLLTRRRKGEFAMMRSVGVNKISIFFGALFEQTMLCAIGVALGCVIFTLTWDYVFIERPLIFLGCYMLGAAISAARAAGTDVLRLLRDKE